MLLKGIAASPGIAIGKVFILDSETYTIIRREIEEKDLPKEIARFEDALIQTRQEILGIQERISDQLGIKHAEIFNAHLLVLEDRTLIEEVITRLKKDLVCVEYIFDDVLKRYMAAFQKVEDEYLKERVADIRDIGKRVLNHLLGKKRETLADIKEKVVLVAYDLSPSDTASLHKKNVIAFATDVGGKTSHTAIMAKALEIPAVVGLKSIKLNVKNGDMLIVDGSNGVVILNPDEETLSKYEQEKTKFAEVDASLVQLRDLPCVTPDGRTIHLAANIEIPDEVASVKSHGANGIGLYRTEFFYLDRTDFPTEEEQFQSYRSVAEQMSPNPVIVRTLDLGGDKFMSQLKVPKEMNPFMGWRAIRFCLARPDIFKIQLRAIMRASAHGKLKIMYPMISGIEEVREANKMLAEIKDELRREGVPFDENVEVGVMIEVPSAALTADILAREISFFSIGTNDLIQYSLAVDRVNEKIAYLYEPAHPAVLRLIKNVIDTGHKHNIWVGMCGEMAGEPAFSLILLGLGLDEFSTSPVNIPRIKQIIRSVDYSTAQKIAEEAMGLATGSEIEEFANMKLRQLVPGMA
ncbi:MAG TPA: phosphoenolpyruvate--protein phosphotransferase [Candidatus Omnitrophota bacterium]|nr:phosphoenolpyruvate--protein phosphotransferase [Candidatus Omnitrophota bacterium]HPN66861.1 phosphoenolpyruvate--protein phosphotransferase [Candidatus Omnitrophota bacterium]